MRLYYFLRDNWLISFTILTVSFTVILTAFLSYTLYSGTKITGSGISKNYDATFSKTVVLTSSSYEAKSANNTSKTEQSSSKGMSNIVIKEEDVKVNSDYRVVQEQQTQVNTNEFYTNTNKEVASNTNTNTSNTTSTIQALPGSLDLPTDVSDTSFKGYMCMHMVDAVSSSQWKFLHSGNYKFTTDPNGILKYNDYYVVAMASYYTNYKVGSTFRVTLDSGKVFDVITGDEKADGDTDAIHKYRPKGTGRGEIIEFIVACGQSGASCSTFNPTLSSDASTMGSFNSLGFTGNVVKIERLGDTSVSDAIN